jgi:FkbM family methyltransferase
MQLNSRLNRSLKENIDNYYTDNYDVHRFDPERISIKNEIKLFFLTMAYKFGLLQMLKRRKSALISSFEYLFDRLNDEYSRDLLIKVLTYRLLGYRKVKLPMNDGHYFEKIKEVERGIDRPKEWVPTQLQGLKLYFYDLSRYGFPCRIYSRSSEVFQTFVRRVYEYKPSGIRPREGDVVIDAGAGWGDTALHFAQLVGDKGKVYSFEFLPGNLEILYMNMGLNRMHKNRVEVIERPIWSVSDSNISCADSGLGNKVVEGRNSQGATYKTISLDDFVMSKRLSKVDFIKMDIELSELEALKGARKVLECYKPRLAICVYHKECDCREITEYIESLNAGYLFYFDHYSIHSEESVLFAQVEEGNK